MTRGGIVIGVACLACGPFACAPAADGPPHACDGGDAQILEGGPASDGGAREAQAEAAMPSDAALHDAPPAVESGAGATDASPDVQAPSTGFVRLANWSPDAPGVDFCLAPHGSTGFTGPIVGNLSKAADGGPSGLTFSTTAGASSAVSAYFPIGPGKYDIRIVVAGADCSVGVVPDFTTLQAISANTYSTVALLGEESPTGGDPGLEVVSFADDNLANGTGINMRFINAAPALIDGADLNVGSSFAFHAVPFGHASTPTEVRLQQPDAGSLPPVDGNGYAFPTLSGATLTAQKSGAAGAVVLPPVTVMSVSPATGAVITIVLVGGTSALSPPAKLMECVDNAGTVGALSSCRIMM